MHCEVLLLLGPDSDDSGGGGDFGVGKLTTEVLDDHPVGVPVPLVLVVGHADGISLFWGKLIPHRRHIII